MIELLTTYLRYLTAHPELVNSIILWNITMGFVYGVLFSLKKEMVEGSKGRNELLEANEQVMYLLNWVWPPIVCYAAYFTVALDVWVWAFVIGIIGYTIGGRWIFEWALAFKSGKSSMDNKKGE